MPDGGLPADGGQDHAQDAGAGDGQPGNHADASTPVDGAVGAPDAPPDGPAMVPPAGIAIPGTTQRPGNASAGYTDLVNAGYISIGIPWSGFSAAMTPLDPSDTLPGRTGDNANVGYTWNVSTTSDGIEIVSSNCLSCHAARIPGTNTLMVGLGFQQHAPAIPSGSAVDPTLIALGLTSVAETDEYTEYGAHLLDAVGNGLAATGALAAHHDPATLVWSSAASFNAGTGLNGWVDVPPWWRVAKLNGLYANGMGRGDHVHQMMSMTLFSVHDVAEAEQLDTLFVDIAAYIRSIAPPAFPASVDATLAATGQTVFNQACASCHGTYGANGTYPNLLISASEVGTDSELADKSWLSSAAVAWFNQAPVFSDNASVQLLDGYVAPPLDGIWATAPFFHNGSVPTLAGVLDSSQRPASWAMSFGQSDFDFNVVGWTGASSSNTYDTTQPGSSNQGHTYGDALSAADRAAVLEYLKTL